MEEQIGHRPAQRSTLHRAETIPPHGDPVGRAIRRGCRVGGGRVRTALPHGCRQLGKPLPWRARQGPPDVVRKHEPCPKLGPSSGACVLDHGNGNFRVDSLRGAMGLSRLQRATAQIDSKSPGPGKVWGSSRFSVLSGHPVSICRPRLAPRPIGHHARMGVPCQTGTGQVTACGRASARSKGKPPCGPATRSGRDPRGPRRPIGGQRPTFQGAVAAVRATDRPSRGIRGRWCGPTTRCKRQSRPIRPGTGIGRRRCPADDHPSRGFRTGRWPAPLTRRQPIARRHRRG